MGQNDVTHPSQLGLKFAYITLSNIARFGDSYFIGNYKVPAKKLDESTKGNA